MKISQIIKILIFSSLVLTFPAVCKAWNGYDYDNKTEVEIGPGNLIREGSIIQFYDSKIDNYRTAKINFIDSVAGGTRIQLRDLDSKKERNFIMQNE